VRLFKNLQSLYLPLVLDSESVVRSVHLLAIGQKIAEMLANLRLLSLEEAKSGKMHYDSGIQVKKYHVLTHDLLCLTIL
jgi:hypothetical protein